MGYDRKFLVWALCFAVFGMGLGIFMAASHDHTLHVAHAHILLVGFVVSLVYGIIHKLWLPGPSPRLALAQYLVHVAGAIVMSVGLILFYGGLVPLEKIDPVLALASFAVLVSGALMLYMVVRMPRTA